VQPGLAATVSLMVTSDDTAVALGSGDVDVLGTPRVIALAEQATCAAIAESLGAGQTTVGSEVQLTHLAPTPVGMQVSADAVLDSVDGRKLVFKVTVNDPRGLIAAGYVTRVLVDRARFMERATDA
jgi:fluoroacetyl-CoA thioesterase